MEIGQRAALIQTLRVVDHMRCSPVFTKMGCQEQEEQTVDSNEITTSILETQLSPDNNFT